jgi:hypothetical protein
VVRPSFHQLASLGLIDLVQDTWAIPVEQLHLSLSSGYHILRARLALTLLGLGERPSRFRETHTDANREPIEIGDLIDLLLAGKFEPEFLALGNVRGTKLENVTHADTTPSSRKM